MQYHHTLRQYLLVLLSFAFIGSLLQSCSIPGQTSQSRKPTEESIHRQQRADYGEILNYAAGKVAEKIQKTIAPQSGRELQHEVNLYPIYYNEAQGWVACDMETSFLARSFFRGVGYGTCSLKGRIFLIAPRYKGEAYKVEYSHISHNDQLVKVSNEGERKWLKEGFTLQIK